MRKIISIRTPEEKRFSLTELKNIEIAYQAAADFLNNGFQEQGKELMMKIIQLLLPRTLELKKQGLEKNTEFIQLDKIYQNCRKKIASLQLLKDHS